MTWQPAHIPQPRPLAIALIALAETPDGHSDLDEQLATIAQLAAERIVAARYASITVLRDENHTTVAASSEVAKEIDDIQ